MNNTSILALFGLLTACGKGAGPEPKTAEKEEPPIADTEPSAAEAASLQPIESGRELVYAFSFNNAASTVTMCVDGPFARVDQSWSAPAGSEGRPFGAEKSRLIFDSANNILTVINKSKNTYSKIDATRMAKAQDDMEKGTPMSLGNLAAAGNEKLPTITADGLPAPTVPLPSASPKKRHPENCAVFERELPQGLKEETCFLNFSEDPNVSTSLSPLISMANFTGNLPERIREFETIAAVANAVEWDTGLPSVQFKFGDSPFEEDNTAMDAWDRTFILKEQRSCTVLPEDLNPPEDAVEEFGLLPWNTPFIVTALPK